MAKRTRISKLAQTLGREEDEVLAAARSLGLPYTLPSHQVTPDAEIRIKAALSRRDFNPQDAPRPAQRPAKAPPKPVFEDPLAESWMDLAMADDFAFKQAQKDLERDRAMNRPPRHTHASPPRGSQDPGDWAPPEPTPMARTKSSGPKPNLGIVPGTLLKNLGFQGKSSRKFLTPLLSQEALTLLKKAHLSEAEAKKVGQEIGAKVARCCGDRACVEALSESPRQLMTVRDQSRCDHCHGSNAERQVKELEHVLRNAGVTKILVIGGNTQVHIDLKDRFPDWVQLKLIGGQDRITKKDARQHLQWAEVAAMWGPRLKWHKVSDPYRRQLTSAGRRVIHVPQASIEQLAHHIQVHLTETHAAEEASGES